MTGLELIAQTPHRIYIAESCGAFEKREIKIRTSLWDNLIEVIPIKEHATTIVAEALYLLSKIIERSKYFLK